MAQGRLAILFLIVSFIFNHNTSYGGGRTERESVVLFAAWEKVDTASASPCLQHGSLMSVSTSTEARELRRVKKGASSLEKVTTVSARPC